MTDKNKLWIEELVNMIFHVFGVLMLFFSGYVLKDSLMLSFIFLIVGLASLMIQVEYTKEEAE